MKGVVEAMVLDAIKNDPDGWTFDSHYAIYRDRFAIWIANRPYSDLEVGTGEWPYGNKYRLRGWFFRRKVRRLLDALKEQVLARAMGATIEAVRVPSVCELRAWYSK